MSASSLRGRLAAIVMSACATGLMLNGCSAPITTPTPPAATASLLNGGQDGLLIPRHVERSDQGQSRLGLPVQIDGKSIYLMLDTGTQGVRVLSSVLPRTSYPAAARRWRLRPARRYRGRWSGCRSASSTANRSTSPRR